MSTKVTRPPDHGVYLDGMVLHNAKWDWARAELDNLPTGETGPCPMPVVWLRPVDISRAHSARKNLKANVYNCPVFVSSQASQGWQHIVTNLELPTLASSAHWTQLSVHLSCTPLTHSV